LASLSAKIEAMCDGKKIFYIDCNEYFSDSEGYLYASLTGDGYHPTVNGYRKWRNWIAFAVEKLGI
jgi:lysophospholipase L1-like esterase